MRRALIGLMLAVCACSEPEEESTKSDFDPRVLSSPKEAVDLDPDPGVIRVKLRAAAAVHRIGDRDYDGYAYNGQLPGPTIRGKVGDTLVVELENALDFETTLHWHGMRVPYEMDGVTWQSSPVMPGQSFTYSFSLTDAGTFWYHPHFDTERQVDRGLYGAVIVEEPAEPVLDDELVVFFDAWGELPAESTSSPHTAPLSGPTFSPQHTNEHTPDPGRWTVNARVAPVLPAASGRSLRVRMINASSDDYLDLHAPALRRLAGDQGLFAALETPEHVLLAPGDRAELEWLLGAEDFTPSAEPYSLHGGEALGAASDLFTVETAGDKAPPPGAAWPFSGAVPSADTGATDVVYVFTGDAGGNDWRINGELFPDVTIEELALGTDAVIELRNASATEHPFHLHGLSFEVLSIDGVAPEQQLVEDTFNLKIGQIVRTRVVLDNAGDWMAHCHLLSHAEGGMMTVLRVKP